MNSLKVGLLTLSNPARKDYLQPFILKLEQNGIFVTLSDLVYSSTTPLQRATEWNTMMQSQEYDYVIDVSGGDLASLTLPFLDYEAYKNTRTWFCGYSDLTCVLNALVSITGKPAILFQPVGHRPFEEIVQWLHGQDTRSLFTWQCDPLLEGHLDGKVCGGNIRCLLKTAGTPYFPQVQDQVLFLESNSGNPARILAYFGQLQQMGVFEQVQGIMLGQFTQLDDAFGYAGSSQLLKDMLEGLLAGQQLPVWRTPAIGHSADSKALWVGKKLIIHM